MREKVIALETQMEARYDRGAHGMLGFLPLVGIMGNHGEEGLWL